MSGKLSLSDNQCDVFGYEIHCGYSQGSALTNPLIKELSIGTTGVDGFISPDNQIAATYLHGLFDHSAVTSAVLQWVKTDHGIESVIDIDEHREVQLERLAGICEQYLQMDEIEKILQAGVTTNGNKKAVVSNAAQKEEV